MSTSKHYDLVISNGRTMDPKSGMDEVRNVGILDGVIRAIASDLLSGDDHIDAKGLVVSPGFIDLHSHSQDAENYEIQALDGVTTALELEVGVSDVDRWYSEREGKTAINFGASAGHIPVRMKVMNDPGEFLPIADAAHRPASDDEIEEMKSQIRKGLQRGALAVGFGLQYTPAASRLEVIEMFGLAAQFDAPCHVHMRGMGHLEPMNSIEGFQELIAATAVTGAPLHVVHIQSSGLQATRHLLQMIAGATSRGLDVTTECYPYTAALTGIESAIFDEGWQDKLGISHEDLEWTLTGERLTATTFSQHREEGGMVIMHMIPEDAVQASVSSPEVMIATDGFLRNGKGHPRTSGSYSRVLGRFVREAKSLSLMNALRKMTIMPAERLEDRAPLMNKKGRIAVGADADLAIFDPDQIVDRSTFQNPSLSPDGMRHVLVNGTPVVRDGTFQIGATPGRGILAPIQ